MSQQWKPYQIMLAGLAVVVVVGATEAFFWQRHNRAQPAASPTPSATATATATPTVTPPPSASASPTAPASPSAAALPASASAFVGDFYAAYASRNLNVLAAMFTPDTTPELLSLHSTLFTGLDTSGQPGGPTLFSTNSAMQSAASHTVTGVVQSGAGWALTVSEKRVDGSGASQGMVTTVLTLAPSGSGWLVDSYAHSGSTGKYDGFIAP